MNHLLNIGTYAIDIGLFSIMLWCFNEREKIMCIIELFTGSRFHISILNIGKLRYDINLTWIIQIIYWILKLYKKLKYIINILSNNRLWKTRLYEIGIINKNICLYYGFSGVIARSSNILIDGRLINYELYSNIKWNTYLSYLSDCFNRYNIRINEIIESIKICWILCLFSKK